MTNSQLTFSSCCRRCKSQCWSCHRRLKIWLAIKATCDLLTDSEQVVWRPLADFIEPAVKHNTRWAETRLEQKLYHSLQPWKWRNKINRMIRSKLTMESSCILNITGIKTFLCVCSELQITRKDYAGPNGPINLFHSIPTLCGFSHIWPKGIRYIK